MTLSSRIDVVAREIHNSEVGQETMLMLIEMQRLLAMAMKVDSKMRTTMAVDEVAETIKTAVSHNGKVEVNVVSVAVIAAAVTRHKMKVEEEALEQQLGDVVLVDEADIETTTAEMRLIKTMHTRQRTP